MDMKDRAEELVERTKGMRDGGLMADVATLLRDLVADARRDDLAEVVARAGREAEPARSICQSFAQRVAAWFERRPVVGPTSGKGYNEPPVAHVQRPTPSPAPPPDQGRQARHRPGR